MTTLSQAILQAATRWFDETFEGEKLLSRMEDMRLIAQAEGFKSACHATLQSELEEVFQLQGAVLEDRPDLTVWFGEMPESNGKTNYTAILRRKVASSILDGLSSGITIARSEYPDRVRYEADRMRYLIGELEVEPFILDYDSDKHSGYVHPDRFEQMAESKGYDVTKTECGHYLDKGTRDLHEGWKAARSTW